jgi:Abnormal spindle-like microcephaly-assoc'd, ASPM-SPD-2-Hydin
MDKAQRVCVSLGLLFVGSVFFPVPLCADVGVAPTSLSFGSVAVNTKSATATVVVTNDGRHSVSILRISSSLPEFIVVSSAMPITLDAHGSASFQVAFEPNAAQSFSGSIVISAKTRNGSTSTASVAVTGTGLSVTPTQTRTHLLSGSASSLSFGNTLVGSSASQATTLTNSGSGDLTISQAAIIGAGFTVSGLTGAVTLGAGQSLTLKVNFAPATTGSTTGSLSVVSNATSSPATIVLTGTGVQPKISVVPASVSFANIPVGVTSTQSLIIKNPGTANLSLTQASLAGTAFSFSGLALPLSLPPGGSSTFSVAFTPASASGFYANLTLVNNTPNSPFVIPLAATVVSSVLQLKAAPTSLSFGSLATGTSATQSVTLTNTGNSSVSVSKISVSGTGFTATGFTVPIALAAGQSTSFSMTFDPTTSGSFPGSVTVTGNAANSPLVISLSGSGTPPVSHSVTLSWTPSSSSFAGFNVYRGSVSGGPYTKVNSALIPIASYTDTSVASGQTYYYVATEENSAGTESAYSNQISATIP